MFHLIFPRPRCHLHPIIVGNEVLPDAKVISRDAGLANVASPAARLRVFGMGGMGQKWILPGLVNIQKNMERSTIFHR